LSYHDLNTDYIDTTDIDADVDINYITDNIMEIDINDIDIDRKIDIFFNDNIFALFFYFIFICFLFYPAQIVTICLLFLLK